MHKLHISSSLRRLQTHFPSFKYLNIKNFCTKSTEAPKSQLKQKEPFDSILYTSHTKHVLEITLNQPKKLNALDYRMIKNLIKRVREWVPENLNNSSSDDSSSVELDTDADKIPKVILMTGNGKHFCAGGDVTSLYHLKQNKASLKVIKDFFRYEYLLDYSLTKIDPIQVAFWNGVVMGGGVGLSVNSPIRIATDTSVFAMPETAIGLFPDVGSTWFLPRIFNEEPSIGLYVGLTGERIKGKDLARCGFATHFVPAHKMEGLKAALIEKINENSNLGSVDEICRSFSDYVYKPDDFYFNREDEIKRVFQFDSLDDIMDRLRDLQEIGSELEKSWASLILANFAKFSPISLHVTFESLKRGTQLKSIEEAFNIEAQLIGVFMENKDFYEGVRALLIDKDNNPKWQYKSLKDVPNVDELIKKYFNRKEEITVDPEEENDQ